MSGCPAVYCGDEPPLVLGAVDFVVRAGGRLASFSATRSVSTDLGSAEPNISRIVPWTGVSACLSFAERVSQVQDGDHYSYKTII